MMDNTPVYISPVRASRLFDIDRSTIYRWIKQGLLTLHEPKHTTRTWVKTADVERLIVGDDPAQE